MASVLCFVIVLVSPSLSFIIRFPSVPRFDRLFIGTPAM
jgi:hypothetical protein